MSLHLPDLILRSFLQRGMCAAPNTNWPGIQYTQQIIPIPKVEYTDTNQPTNNKNNNKTNTRACFRTTSISCFRGQSEAEWATIIPFPPSENTLLLYLQYIDDTHLDTIVCHRENGLIFISPFSFRNVDSSDEDLDPELREGIHNIM